MSLLDHAAPDLWQLVLGRGEAGGAMVRQARASVCGKCEGHRLHGLDADVAALPTFVDPYPLSALGEVQATIAGLRTYELSRRAGAYQLDHRDQSHVAGRPAGSGAVDVLAQHRCGVRLDHAPPVLVLRRTAPTTVPPF